MIKGLLDKMSKDKKPVSDPEILELRRKFAELDEIGKQPQGGAQQQAPQSAPQIQAPPFQGPQQSTAPMTNINPASTVTPAVVTKHTIPTSKDVKIKLIDVEQAEQDERMTNMIMEQINQLIEIDDNLNNKIKDLNSKIEENKKNIEQFTKSYETAMSRMDIIERNMEKFMALYEVVTNQYNPFLGDSPEATRGQLAQAQPAVAEKALQAQPAPEAVLQPATPAVIEVPPAPKVEENVQVPSQIVAPAEKAPVVDSPVPAVAPASATSSPVVEDQLDMQSNLLELIETRINEALTQFKLTLHNEVNVNIDRKVSEMVRKIESSINQQLNDSIKNHIEEELREKVEKMVGSKVLLTSPAPEQAETAQELPATPPEPSPAEQTPAPKEGLHHDKEVHPDNYFWLPDGTPVKSLSELVKILRTMDESMFAEHVQADKNDFAEWVRHVLGKPTLADKLMGKDKQEMLVALDAEITS